MSQEHVDVVRNMLAAVSEEGIGGALEFCDPEIVVDATRNMLNPGTYIGTEGLLQWQAGLADVWKEIHVEPLEFIDTGERVVVISELIGRGRSSGIEVKRSSSAQIATVRDGRVLRWEIGYTNREEALEAAGLSE
ncbi:MAG: nuclear transport factor 2 family protein [Acidobacteriota bacterium]